MASIEITVCDLCSKPIKGPGVAQRPVHGCTIQLGHSHGGWGRRTNPVDWSGEVCEDCHAEWEKFKTAARFWIQARGGCRMPDIIINEKAQSVATVPKS